VAQVAATTLDGMASSPPAPLPVVETKPLVIFSFSTRLLLFSRIRLRADSPALDEDGLRYP
jgi:hypothetical protein